ncbi:MAG: hypothetical protein IPP17_04440 [Bacteroidetes bacterium]|nr:hypothetical protein [Bacteroidota bacterium]
MKRRSQQQKKSDTDNSANRGVNHHFPIRESIPRREWNPAQGMFESAQPSGRDNFCEFGIHPPARTFLSAVSNLKSISQPTISRAKITIRTRIRKEIFVDRRIVAVDVERTGADESGATCVPDLFPFESIHSHRIACG